ncbi:L-rhamnose mutarotase [uncultured Cohaesibacter sp.]|uniref:L-rhamnose mutarotase n=1 Tax=uncultured Cohaesibacter sp. TaxID=1002546 RepID=UPI0029C8302B|nr:L-rhamnose mutarotase [uncultured Cohaesibacter sp.]
MTDVKRVSGVIRTKPEKADRYKELHANAWPEINAMIKACNIRNYSIYFKDGYLFSYFEYVGEDFDADMAKMAADPKTQEWWDECIPCLEPLETRAPHEDVWAEMEEVYHLD